MKRILRWLCKESHRRIGIVECHPEKVSNVILDDLVDVNLVQFYFTTDAWLVVQDVIKRKKESNTWLCNFCQHDLSESESIVCEACLEWSHFKFKLTSIFFLYLIITHGTIN